MKLPPHLFAMKAARDEDDKPGPRWNQALPLGVTKFRKDLPGGQWTVTAETCAELVANYRAMGNPRLPVNYFHQSEYDKSLPIEQRIKAGTIVDVACRDDGFWIAVEWTERARGYIRAGEIDELSIEMDWKHRNVNTGAMQGPTLTGCALLGDPLFKEMPRAAASAEQQSNQADEAATGAVMDKKKLIALLGLAENATEEQIEAAVRERDTKLTASASETTTLKAAASAAEATAADLSAKLAASAKKVTELEAQLATDKAAAAQALKASAAETFGAGLIAKGIAIPVVNELKALFASNPETAERLAKLQTPAANIKADGVDSSGEPVKGEAAVKALFARVDERKAAEKIDSQEALYRVRRDSPELYRAAYPEELPVAK